MNPYIVLVCPSCGAKTSVRNDEPSVTCDYCGNSLILLPRIAAPTNYPARVADRPRAPMPNRISLKSTAEGFVLSRRWFTPAHIFMAVFALFWDGFLLFWYGMVFSTGAPLIFVLFPLIHLAVGVGITYSALAGFLNTTYIELAGSNLLIDHYPLPWTGNRKLPVVSIDQLYTKEVNKRTKNGQTTTYTVCAVMQDGHKLDLVTGLPDVESGLFIEQKIEEGLHIKDEPIAGELPH